MTNIAIDSLIKERNKIKSEQVLANAAFNEQITELETAIERLCGKKVWEVEKEFVYEDENPNYIKSSIEE